MLLTDIVEHSPEWHKIRSKNIGGSEIAGLFGVQADYQMSSYTLFMVKSGRIPAPPVDDKPGSLIWFGTMLEPIIAKLAAELNGWDLEKGGYTLDDMTPGMAASIDFRILEPGPGERALGFEGPGNLQIKNVGLIQHMRSWTENEPPYHIILQNQQEMACSNVSWGAIASMVDGNRIEIYRYAARPRTISLIRDRITDFWQSVREGKPPQVDGSNSTAETLKALYPAVGREDPLDLSDDNETAGICAGLIMARADVRGAKKIEQEYQNQLNAKMKGRRRGTCQGYAINGVYTPENPGRRAGDLPPDLIVGKRNESLWYRIKETM